MTNHVKNSLSPSLNPAQTRAICYSGYRRGQNPAVGIFPSYSEILEDLSLLAQHWDCIRLYDAGPHAHTVLEVIAREKLSLSVLMGMDLAAEMNNPNCPWLNPISEEKLQQNRQHNDEELVRTLRLIKIYEPHIAGISIGNEASVDWTDHKVPIERLLHFAGALKSLVSVPVTFCENYVPWASGELDALANTVDVIAVHTYPIWESISVKDALAYTQQNFESVKSRFPNKPVMITEAGWATRANGAGFPAALANPQDQITYCEALLKWSQQEGVLTFLFEAFDEDWKGSDDPAEPEKHWGIYTIDRQPKPVAEAILSPKRVH
jgi:exo-beta-1,3-glucanase (GH17 family)